jgi:hypothetical protein
VPTAGVDGTLEWQGMDPGMWSIAARTADGRFGVASGIRIVEGAKPVELLIDVAPGGSLEISYEGKEKQAVVGLLLDGVRVGFGKSVKPGEVVTVPAPAGAVTLEIRIGDGREPRMKVVQLGAGETKVITLSDENG